MATIPATIVPLPPTPGFRGCVLYKWANMGDGDFGEAVGVPSHSDRSVQVDATDFGVGGTVTMQGSNKPGTVRPTSAGTYYDGPTLEGDYFTLNDPSSTPLEITTEKGEAVLEATMWIRPKVTGDGTTDVDVYLLATRG